jgi:hypothetical protein
MFVWDAHTQAGDLAARMVPPNWAYMDKLWWAIWDTINIATLGTVLAIAMAVPVAFFAARNTTPSRWCCSADRPLYHRFLALHQLADLGADAGGDPRPRRAGGNHRHRPSLDRLLRKLLYEAIEEIDDPGRGYPRHRRFRAADSRLRRGPADHAGLRRHLGVPLGHQHPGVDGARTGRRRRDRPAAERLDHHARLDPGVPDPAGDHSPLCWSASGSRRRSATPSSEVASAAVR